VRGDGLAVTVEERLHPLDDEILKLNCCCYNYYVFVIAFGNFAIVIVAIDVIAVVISTIFGFAIVFLMLLLYSRRSLM
jgi:hypothetical protein